MAVSISIRKKALKPKRKSLEVMAKRIKAEMEEIREEQNCIKEGQRSIREKFEVIELECEQLRKETNLIMKQSACNQIRIDLMFNILRARKDGDFVKADNLAQVLKASFPDSKGSSNGGN